MFNQDENFVQINDWLTTYKNSNDKKIKKQLQNLIVVAAMPFVKKIACVPADVDINPED